jgi:hypothetical protein
LSISQEKNISLVADALSRLDIDSLKIRNRIRSINDSLRIKKQLHQKYQMNIPNAYCLDLQRTSKSQVIRINRKRIAQTYYSI